MLSLARVVWRSKCLHQARGYQSGPSARPPRRRSRHAANLMLKKPDTSSEWWVVDGEMHEIGENVPPRERFVIPRDNISNRRRKALREQFMRRTRLVLKPNEHETWCRSYMGLYNELRENWERLYWDEGYSKKLAQDHANYDSAEDDEEDFDPYRRTPQQPEYLKIGNNGQEDTREKAGLIRDKFEYDREQRMRQIAFAPMSGGQRSVMDQPFNPENYFSGSDDDDE